MVLSPPTLGAAFGRLLPFRHRRDDLDVLLPVILKQILTSGLPYYANGDSFSASIFPEDDVGFGLSPFLPPTVCMLCHLSASSRF